MTVLSVIGINHLIPRWMGMQNFENNKRWVKMESWQRWCCPLHHKNPNNCKNYCV